MTAQGVDSVWIWYLGDAAYKATYGRFSDAGDNSWTKDYLQVSGNCRDLLNSKFPTAADGERVDIEYKWPGEAYPGFIKFSVDRHHLSWETKSGAPRAWRVTPNPTEDGPETLPGNPDAATITEAKEIYASYKDRGIDAYLVAVKLKDEDKVLHIRTYIKNPPPELAFADLSLLPPTLQEVAKKAIPSRACSSIELKDGGTALTPDVADVIKKLEENPNLLLVGPPGTGKTVLLDRLARYIENPGAGVSFDPEINHDAWSESNGVKAGKTRTVVFHPSYSYDNLVLGLMPTPAANGVIVKAATGPLVNLAHYASDGRHALLVLDEFNRGNAASILGDTIALLDRDKRGVATIDLQYSELKIEVPTEFSVGTNTTVNPRFTLPPNLWIIAAMNSSDRSVAPLDAALRRRFSIVEMPPDYRTLSNKLNADETADLNTAFEDWTSGHVGQLAVQLLRAINDRIDAVLGQDFRLGQSNFWQVRGGTADSTLQTLTTAWDTRIVPTLRLQLQDNDDALASILVAGTSEKSGETDTNRAAWWKKANEKIGAYGQPRLHFNEMANLEPNIVLKELIRQSQ